MRTLLASILFASLASCAAGTDASEPGKKTDGLEPGSSERAELMEAIHAGVDPSIGSQPNEYVVDHLAVEAEFAFVSATVQAPGGGEIDWSQSRWSADVEAGLFDGPHMQVLVGKNSQDEWEVVQFDIGATDVWWAGLWDRYPTKTCALYPFSYEGCTDIVEPARGGGDRELVVAAIHEEFDPKFNGQANQIVFAHLQMSSEFVFATGSLQTPLGGELDIQDSEFAELDAEGLFDGPNFSFFLQKDQSGNWTQVFSDIGSTDVSWWGLWTDSGAPCGIFPVSRCTN